MSSRAQALSALGQLTLVRIREFTREPEAVFWAVFFPVLLTSALGIAFSGGAGERLAVVTSSPELARALAGEPGLDVEHLDEPAAAAALRNGQAVLFAARGADGGVVYRFDATNPDGRAAR